MVDSRWILLLFGSAAAILGSADAQIPRVPSAHPRIYLRQEDLPDIRQKIETSEFSQTWNTVKNSDFPLCRAFVYLITGDEAPGRSAIKSWLDTLAESEDNPDRRGRVFFNDMHIGACIYDWCYNLLTDAQKQAFIEAFQRIAASHSPGYPAHPDSHAVVGHNTEGWILTGQLPAGIAIYDESPTMYEAAAALFFSRFVPVRNFSYPAHMHHQGDSYFQTRFMHDQAVSWLFRRMGAGDVLSPEQQFVPYQMLYHLRPDGQQMRSGDTFNDRGDDARKRLIALMTGAYYDDPYLMGMADAEVFKHYRDYGGVFELLFRDPGAEKRPISELPLTRYFPSPMGEMVARTGWNMGVEGRDAVVHMRIGEYFFGNHQHKDFGTFQIYYRGALAISTGIYGGENAKYGSPHWTHYYHQTISKNGLLIFDPEEEWASTKFKDAANDGGQRWPAGSDHPKDLETLLSPDYKMGQVTAHAFGPDVTSPGYSYIAGDITNAYASNKVKAVSRSMVTLNLRNTTYPCVLVVFDRVVATNPQFKKTWLIHSIQEPSINHRTITILRNGEVDGGGQYGGKLVVESLLPSQVTIDRIGGAGKEFWVESTQTNYIATKGGAAEPGAWRVEVSPTTARGAHHFLHVLTVMDDTVSNGPTVQKIETNALAGVKVLDCAVFFSKDGQPLKNVGIAVEAERRIKVLLCDLEPGMWTVDQSGVEIAREEATHSGKCIYFEIDPDNGPCDVARVSD